MKGKIYFARGMSRVLLTVLYAFDIAGIYYITGDILYTAIGAAIILCIMTIQMGVCLLTLRAHSIKNSPRGDANYLQSCMDEVMRRSVAVGRRRKIIHLWIADNEALRCYSVGNNIIVNKSMLRLGDRTMLEAGLANQLSRVYNWDSIFSLLLKLNVFAGMCLLGLSLFGSAVAIILIVALIFGMIFSSWIGFTVGTIMGKAIKWCFGLVMRAFYYTTKVFSAFLCRRQAFEADRYTALLGYSRAMVGMFRLEERMERHAVQTSWIEDLLDDSPSHYRRIVQFERMEEEITRLEQNEHNYEVMPYENPFS